MAQLLTRPSSGCLSIWEAGVRIQSDEVRPHSLVSAAARPIFANAFFQVNDRSATAPVGFRSVAVVAIVMPLLSVITALVALLTPRVAGGVVVVTANAIAVDVPVTSAV